MNKMRRQNAPNDNGVRHRQNFSRRDSLARLFVWGAIGLAMTMSGSSHATVAGESESPAGSGEDHTVRLVVDFGDGMQKVYTQLEWKPDWKVWNVLEAASRHARGLQLDQRGRGQTLLVESIDGVKNEVGRDGRNWIYRVNGEIGDRSAGIYPVKPGDTVLWKFETYR